MSASRWLRSPTPQPNRENGWPDRLPLGPQSGFCRPDSRSRLRGSGSPPAIHGPAHTSTRPFFTPRQNLFRRQGQIPGGVPFFDQILILAGQIRFPRPGEPPRAVGAVRVVGGTGIDCRLPDMSLGAYPPDLPRTAIGDLLWRQRPILGRVPLSQQSRLTSLHAVVV